MTKAEKRICDFIQVERLNLAMGFVTIEESTNRIFREIDKSFDAWIEDKGEAVSRLNMMHKAFVMLSKATKQ